MALAVGALFFALFVFGLLVDRAQFFHAYLVGFIFWIGITLGSMALLMLQHLTGGAWGLIIRRVLEAASRAPAKSGVSGWLAARIRLSA